MSKRGEQLAAQAERNRELAASYFAAGDAESATFWARQAKALEDDLRRCSAPAWFLAGWRAVRDGMLLPAPGPVCDPAKLTRCIRATTRLYKANLRWVKMGYRPRLRSA